MPSNKMCRGIATLALILIPLLAAGCVTWFSSGNGDIGEVFPVITNPTASTTTPMAGEAVALAVTATDPQGQTLTYTWDDAGADGEFTGDGAAVNWSSLTPGTYTITVTVTDSDGNETVETFTITVMGETGPTWALTGLNASNLMPDVGADVDLTAAVTNPDEVALTYTWAGGGTFVGTGNAVTWSSDTAGDFTLSVTVSDGTDDATLSVDVTVAEVVIPNEAPVFMNFDEDPPVAYELHGDVSAPVATQRIRFTHLKATDPDGDALTYEWTADGAGAFTDIDVDVDGFITAYWAADAPGTYVVTVTADDGKGGVASVSAVTSLASDDIVVTDLPTDFDYVGYDGCNLCHSDTVTAWMETNHADALERSINPNGHGFRNEGCYECHGAGIFPAGEGGFIDQELTPQFGNIQCETCHGGGSPAGMGGGHKPSPYDPGVGYQTDVDGNYVEIDGVYQYDETYDGSMGYGCGLCHEGSRHGAFESWLGSGHAHAPKWEDDGAGGLAPSHEMTGSSCAKCHNGAEFVRVIADGGDAEEILPEDFDPSIVMIGCATCHDPHANEFEGQLRIDAAGQVGIPFSDTDNVPAMVSGGRGNTCISCHNGRRDLGDYISRVTNGSGHFGPHGNPQGATLFGMMAGAIPYTDPPVLSDFAGNHAHQSMAQDSCVDCHMYSRPYISSDEPHLWGHEMDTVVEACAVCHVGETDMDALMAGLRTEFADTMQEFVDAWPAVWKDVTDPANPELYNRPVVSDPPEVDDHEGPPKDDPVGNAYRAALWIWYLWNNDGSHAAHNPTYFRSTMAAAIAEVEALNAL